MKIKLLYPESKLPKKAHKDDVGYDLYAHSINQTEDYFEYGLGISATPSPGTYLEIVPRSSISNVGFIQCNSIGIVDPSYTGELKVRFYVVSGGKPYKVGDRVAQLIVRPVIEDLIEVVDIIEETERSGGFGSTGV